MLPASFKFPQAYDPQMHQEDRLTLLRSTSAGRNTNASPDHNMSSTSMGMNSPKSGMPTTTTTTTTTTATAAAPPSRSGPAYRNFVFTDPVAFRYLEEDSTTVVLERRGRLKGYEIYLVEQWACSRVHPTFIITRYTGEENHSVVVGVLGVPADKSLWSPRLRVYFNAVTQFHARETETPLGILMTTNLSSFPSALTVIPVPHGDVRKHREDFIVNENLKRLGCSGRSGMTLAPPSTATQAKFYQLYQASTQVPLFEAIIELVKLCQVALIIFGKLEQEYADGLLCDVTESAAQDWWTDIGYEYYNIEPSDGILGPTTVAALLGLLMGARNRLNYYGAPVSKDAFSIYHLKHGISYFQKSQKMERTRRLDRQTLDRLHKATAKAAAGEGWAVPKAVKSTAAQLSGKRGEIVMGMVGRDKPGIGEIETLDFDRFISLVQGERSKWLWYGKPRRGGTSDPDAFLTFNESDQGGYRWSHSRADSVPADEEPESRKRDREKDGLGMIDTSKPPLGSVANITDSPNEKDTQLRRTVLKSVTGKMSDARSGFGRIKDAVGRRGHSSKLSKDDTADLFTPLSAGSTSTFHSGTPQTAGPNKTFTWKNTPNEYHNGGGIDSRLGPGPLPPSSLDASSLPSTSKLSLLIDTPVEACLQDDVKDSQSKWSEQAKDIRKLLVTNEPSVAGSVCSDGDLEGPLLESERNPDDFRILLHRRHSIDDATRPFPKNRNEAWWPRQMSFSNAEEAILTWEDMTASDDDACNANNWATSQRQKYLATSAQALFTKILTLQNSTTPFVESQLANLDSLSAQASQDQAQFQTLYAQLAESYESMKQSSIDILSDQRAQVSEGVKDVDMLGAKLEYEINALVSKVQEFEDGIAGFERRVGELEGRAGELEENLNVETWMQYLVRRVTGFKAGEGFVGGGNNNSGDARTSGANTKGK